MHFLRPSLRVVWNLAVGTGAVRRLAVGVCCLLGAGLGGCAPSRYGRIGKAVALPSGAPRTPCERSGWYELVPTRVLSETMQGGAGYNTLYSQEYVGIGLFRAGAVDPESLSDSWLLFRDPELQRRHEARTKPVEDASIRTLLFAGGGVGGMLVGAAAFKPVKEQNATAAQVLAVSALAVGAIGIIGALISSPSAGEVLGLGARRSLLLPGEDDLNAAARGIDATNAEHRRRCEQRAPAVSPVLE